LKAAAWLIAGEGLAALGPNRVAGLAGCDKALIYRYFGDINGLCEALARRNLLYPRPDTVIEKAAVSAESPAGDVLATFFRAMREVLQERLLTRALLAERQRSGNPLVKALMQQRSEYSGALPGVLGAAGSGAGRMLRLLGLAAESGDMSGSDIGAAARDAAAHYAFRPALRWEPGPGSAFPREASEMTVIEPPERPPEPPRPARKRRVRLPGAADPEVAPAPPPEPDPDELPDNLL